MKTKYILLSVLSLLLMTSCVDNAFEKQQTSDEFTITGGFVTTKTELINEKNYTSGSWVAQDAIGITSSSQINLKYLAQNSGQSTVFKADGEELDASTSGTILAYYPYGPADGAYGTYPSYHEQFYEKGVGAYDLMYAVGSISNNNLSFTFDHLCTFLRITISKSEFEGMENPTLVINSPTTYLVYDLIIGINEDKSSKYPLVLYYTNLYQDVKFRLTKDVIAQDSSSTITFYVVINAQDENVTLNFAACDGDGEQIQLFSKTTPKGGLEEYTVYNVSADTEIAAMGDYEKTILNNIYSKMGGDNWTKKDNWCSDAPVSDWYGVKVNNRGRVVSLSLPNNNVSGSIIDDIGHLTSLEELDLSNNNLKNSVNEELENLPSIKKLNLSYNNLSDSLSTYLLYSLPTLESLDLSHNNISGSLPYFTSTNLKKLDLSYNNFSGSISEYLYYIMNADTLALHNNKLSGDIPTVVQNHENWYKHWANIIDANEFDTSDLVLPLAAFSVNDLNGNTITNEVLKDKSLTAIYNWSDTSTALNQTLIDLMNEYPERFSVIGYHVSATSQDAASFKSYVTNNSIPWSNFEATESNRIGNLPWGRDSKIPVFYLADRGGDILYQNLTTEITAEEFAEYVRTYLGKNMYTSADYSKDGEVLTLQKATVGKGIDIVLLGEGFVDLAMESGGEYEERMKESMEQFFLFEPFKTFRDRFNIYTVKVVSPNELGSGGRVAINEDNTLCIKYANKVPNLDQSIRQIAVIYNTRGYASRSYTTMYSDGSYVGFIMEWTRPTVINHEIGGHGFGQLWDEYVEEWNDDADKYQGTITDDVKENLDYWWTNFGFGANVDYNNDSTTIRWSRLLNDSRYKDTGLGIYEGGYLYRYGVYRPNYNSMMRNNSDTTPFNAPSRESIYKNIMKRSEGSSWTYDYEKFVEYDAINRVQSKTASQQEPSKAELLEWKKKHKAPVLINKTWKEAMYGK